MADENVRKDSPEGLRREPPRADALPGPADDDARLRQPASGRTQAWVARWLGVFCALPLSFGLGAMLCQDSEMRETLAEWGGCLSLMLGPAALISGGVGLRLVSRSPVDGRRGRAVFGIWMGAVACVAGFLILLASLAIGLRSMAGAGSWK